MLLTERELERWKIPGAAFGVLHDGSTETWSYGEVDVDTPLRVASITKPFTATLVRALVADGALDLDDPLLDGITLRHALSHRSGLDCELTDDLAVYGAGEDALGRAVDDLGKVKRWTPPGELWAYANTGYWLAGHAAAEAAGTTFEDAMAEHVLEPLGLAATGFEHPSPYPRARRPSGGLVSTVPDLLAFAARHLDDRELRPLHEPLAAMPGGGYALGWGVSDRDGTRVVFHGGSFESFRSLLLLVPERRFAVAVLTNAVGGRVATREASDRALERYLGLPRPASSFIELPPEELEALAGRYRNPRFDVDVRVVDGGLELEAPDEPLVRGRPVGPREFEIVTEGEDLRERFDFPRPGLLRFSVLAERV